MDVKMNEGDSGSATQLPLTQRGLNKMVDIW